MTTLILMRHGETVANTQQIYQGQGNSGLSKNGLEQAKIAADYFSKVKIHVVYSSDLKRSYDTASIIAGPHGHKVTAIRDLRERYYGDWEGLTFGQINRKHRKLYDLWLKDPDKARIPKAETLKALQARGVEAIEDLLNKHEGSTVLVVGHGGINRAILFHYLGLDLNNFWKIRQNNCCMNVVEFMVPYPRVVIMNNACYLSDLCHKHRFNRKQVKSGKKDVLS